MKVIKYILLMSILFSLNSCSDKDSCNDLVCINGSCINSECECNEGYTGINCSDELELSRVIANDIIHLWSPEFDIGSNGQNVTWDVLGGKKADIFLRVYLNSNPNDFTDSDVLIDQIHDQRASFEFSYIFENPRELYKIEFWDNDNPDDFMVSMDYLPYKTVEGLLQTEKIFSIDGIPQGIEMDLSYEF